MPSFNTQIRVSESTYKRLDDRKRGDESFDEVVARTIDEAVEATETSDTAETVHSD